MKFSVENCKNTTAMRNKIRTDMTNLLFEFLKSKCEDEEKDVVQVGTNEIAVCVALADDPDGFPCEVNMIIKAETKPHLDSVGAKGREVKAYDRIAEAEAYEAELKTKAAKRKGK